MRDNKTTSLGVNLKAVQFVFLFSVMTLGSAQSTNAGSASAPLSISATVIRTCRVSSSALASNNNDLVITGTNIDLSAVAKITVVCTNGANLSVAIDAGSLAAGTLALGSILKGSEKLSYEIDKNSGSVRLRAGSPISGSTLGAIPSARNNTLPARENLRVESSNAAVTFIVNF